MKKLDLLLLNPSARKQIYQNNQEAMEYPAIEPPYLAALTAEFIRSKGYDVRILDANLENLSAEDAVNLSIRYDPSFLQIIVHGNQPSASTQLMGEVGKLCRGIKEQNNNIKILLSGTHPSALPKRTLEEEACDFVARGEGFHTILGLISKKHFSEIPGLWYREEKKIIAGKPDILMDSKEIDFFLPKAAWDLLSVEKYRAHDWHCLDNIESRQPYASIYTSFGCPFNCSFCCINASFSDGGKRKNRIRYRNPQLVVDEIESLVENYNLRNIKFIDEMFIFQKQHYAGIANEIINRGLGDSLNIWVYARIDIEQKNMDLLKKAGINWQALGIESGSKYVREGMKKGRFTRKDIVKQVTNIKNAGMNVVGNYIFGLSDDTNESMQETLSLAEELNCERPNFYCAMAYPGSNLYALAQERKITLPKDWDSSRALLPEEKGGPGWIGYSQHAYETWPLPSAALHPEQILSFRDKAVFNFFSENKQYFSMLSEKFGYNNAQKFCKINAQKFKRKILGD